MIEEEKYDKDDYNPFPKERNGGITENPGYLGYFINGVYWPEYRLKTKNEKRKELLLSLISKWWRKSK